ncbi:hypothetical protein Cni_G09869 [Canna indica]|uniref:Uncharacterized protein n=1 Tax=Canna indica TaxID=4628 RepID=A0AAQ3QA43_9LILI|nr:hypothetical protein Cni_G09869 [Canna indica]
MRRHCRYKIHVNITWHRWIFGDSPASSGANGEFGDPSPDADHDPLEFDPDVEASSDAGHTASVGDVSASPSTMEPLVTPARSRCLPGRASEASSL